MDIEKSYLKKPLDLKLEQEKDSILSALQERSAWTARESEWRTATISSSERISGKLYSLIVCPDMSEAEMYYQNLQSPHIKLYDCKENIEGLFTSAFLQVRKSKSINF